MRSALALAIASSLGIGLLTSAPRAQAPPPDAAPPAAACALRWSGHEGELEQFLRSAKVANMKAVPVGVTRPSRAYFESGGLVRVEMQSGAHLLGEPAPPLIRVAGGRSRIDRLHGIEPVRKRAHYGAAEKNQQ